MDIDSNQQNCSPLKAFYHLCHVRFTDEAPVTEDGQGLSFQIASLDQSGRLNIWVSGHTAPHCS